MTAPRPEGDERLDPEGLEAAAKALYWHENVNGIHGAIPWENPYETAVAAYLTAIENPAPTEGAEGP